MKAIIIIITSLIVSTASAVALSVSQPAQPHLTGVTVAHPGTLQVRQSTLHDSASTDSANILQ